ncbi:MULTISPECIES: sirohydrochlorin chelatase [Brevibacillus]|uniref:sirohydrochlorin chelatase n=1 Tax=Brevibacillus TaxID=55080 RepID=UPI00156AA9E7|nr:MULTISPECIES: CbiX/SirB N-terminal domain-containing protein [Brevibacillus]NRQ54405.1 hypothetical protein [Brevibacillus sp. HD1.4A]WDV93910.1 CbiX/SirB N-terminal domain-containing protein [Brevibacillus parabrevis]
MAKTAALVIAHGSPDPDWLNLVESAVRQCQSELPTRVAYLGGVEGRSISDEWKRLEASGAKRIVVVPLFASAGSNHVTEIRAMLGLTPWPAWETEQVRIPVRARILWCPPLEDHSLVEQIVGQRAMELAEDPRKEALLLVGHGSDWPGCQERWEKLLRRMTFRLQNRYAFAAAGYATLRSDTLREQVVALSEKGEVIVLPLFVSQGYFTRKAIPARLAELSYRYNGSAYLPHPLIADWIAQSIRMALVTDLFTQRSVYEHGREKTVEVGR